MNKNYNELLEQLLQANKYITELQQRIIKAREYLLKDNSFDDSIAYWSREKLFEILGGEQNGM